MCCGFPLSLAPGLFATCVFSPRLRSAEVSCRIRAGSHGMSGRGFRAVFFHEFVTRLLGRMQGFVSLDPNVLVPGEPTALWKSFPRRCFVCLRNIPKVSFGGISHSTR